MPDNTNSSFLTTPFLRVSGNDDLYGKNMKNQTFFKNIERFWKNCHHGNRRYFFWFGELMPRVERNIRKRWLKRLPGVELSLKFVKDSCDHFNPFSFNDNPEDYFQTLQRWKLAEQVFYQKTLYQEGIKKY